MLVVPWRVRANALIVAIVAVGAAAAVFVLVDQGSHSVSDTLYGIFPFFVCSFPLLDWIAARTSRESN